MQKVRNMKKVLFILGTTCSGKSDFAVKLAKMYNGEIISADSVQVYKNFDIGSAKIIQQEMDGIVHYGIDIKEPNEEFTVYNFVEYTKEKIDEILSKNKLPIIVGGTGLYAKALIEGYNFGDTDKHSEFRKEIEKEIEEKGIDEVYSRLKDLSPKLAKDIDKKNPVRVTRAFEIAKFGGEKQSKIQSQYHFLVFALTMDRQLLYTKINKRVDSMLNNGLIDEVKRLYQKYGQDIQPMRAIGYKEVVSFLKGEISEHEMTELIKRHTRNYAKRQLTFLKGMKNVIYLDSNEKTKALNFAKGEIDKWLTQKKF